MWLQQKDGHGYGERVACYAVCVVTLCVVYMLTGLWCMCSQSVPLSKCSLYTMHRVWSRCVWSGC